jgi:hypothetical protein
MLLVFLMVVCPHQLHEDIRGKGYLDNASLFLGLVVCAFHLSNFLTIYLKPTTIRKHPLLKRLLASSSLTSEKDLKYSGAKKMNNLIQNSLHMLESSEREGVLGTHFGEALHNFSVLGEVYEQTGGFGWTWRRLWNNELTREHGIRFSPRLISSNITQYIVCLYVLLAGINLTNTVKLNFDEDKTVDSVTGIINYALDRTVDEGLLEAVLENWTGLLRGFIVGQSNEGGFNCADTIHADLLESACNFKSGDFNCNPDSGIDYVCAFANSASNSTNITGAGLAEQLGLLDASGFDVRTLESSLRVALDQAATTSVNSLYPSSQYM